MDNIKEESLQKVSGGTNQETTEEFHGYSVGPACISCGACVGVCPTEAISMGSYEAVINQEDCAQCGYYAEECPVNAIQKH